eukprot:TRINITY_DN8560_c0_g1_i1.p1 TRINITY_DN8560_c0_g1~~TRINITY_DN8560_c0_g1_i1.p1  ORF type:complete len:181 (+),score=28.87 TRINITY_DN8560_c0_g1_i1:72-545(+)
MNKIRDNFFTHGFREGSEVGSDATDMYDEGYGYGFNEGYIASNTKLNSLHGLLSLAKNSLPNNPETSSIRSELIHLQLRLESLSKQLAQDGVQLVTQTVPNRSIYDPPQGDSIIQKGTYRICHQAEMSSEQDELYSRGIAALVQIRQILPWIPDWSA